MGGVFGQGQHSMVSDLRPITLGYVASLQTAYIAIRLDWPFRPASRGSARKSASPLRWGEKFRRDIEILSN